MIFPEAIRRAADLVRRADGLVICAGAGMGVDSGLPDFRGADGFWGAYPALKAEGVRFQDIANPSAFLHNPDLAWRFYAHRIELYRNTQPHAGFGILRRWCDAVPYGGFVYTSNVDGHFQRAGFAEDRVYECHGSLGYLQCVEPCRQTTWLLDTATPVPDSPRCPHCGDLARPNVLMFDDWGYVHQRCETKSELFDAWYAGLGNPVIIEIGAGTTIPGVRRFATFLEAPIIRINPQDADIQAPHIGLRATAMEGIEALQEALGEIWRDSS